MAALVISGCDDSRSSSNLRLEVERNSWDLINLRWQVSKGDFVLAGAEVVLYSADYDTLYAGDGIQINIPDKHLGDSERLLIEVCGQINREAVCAQEGLLASPKRIQARNVEIRYPVEPSFTQGQFEVDLTVVRQVFDDAESWEPVQVDPAPEAYLVASVGQSAHPIILSSHSHSRSFDLSQHENYGEFSYDLRSAMYSKQSADVYLKVRAQWNGIAATMAEEMYKLAPPSEEEREDDLHFFAQQAANQVIQRLFGGDVTVVDSQVQVDSWRYDRFEDQYSADLEIRWRERQRRGRGIIHLIRGTLTANQAGSDAVFRADRATRHARSAWRNNVVANSSLPLESLRTNLKRQSMDATEEELAADSLLPAIAQY